MKAPHFERVGIALAAYSPKREYFLGQLDSIRKQTHPQWKCFISSDSPLAELRSVPEFRPFFEDSRFEWHENPSRLGSKGNFQAAIQRAAAWNADAIACSDQDDVWYPEKLEVSLRDLNRAGPLSMVHCDMHLLKEGSDGKDSASVWSTERRGVGHVSAADLLIRNVVAGCAMLFDAELARRFPEIPAEFPYHDHWYALVAAVHGGVHAIPVPLLGYRQHGDNVLGVTAYPGLAGPRADARERGLRDAVVARWALSRELARRARTELPRLGLREKLLFESRDGGLFLAVHGIGAILTGDPALGRACLARAAGKFLAPRGDSR